MRFEKEMRKARILSPLRGFEVESQPIEYRKDPLTGVLCRINEKRAERVKQTQKKEENLGKIIEETKKNCFFCPENIEKSTPKFPKSICEDGRIVIGDCSLFPNLFSFGEYHAVATLTSEHYVAVDGFTPGMIRDNLRACVEFANTIWKKDKEVKYPMYNWNHLPPSAASIIHPHIQFLIDREPTVYWKKLFDESKRYYKREGRSFWKDLIEEERGGRRFIYENDSVFSSASFAPQGNREVVIVFREAKSFSDLDEKMIGDFSTCIMKILKGYGKIGVECFNLTTFSAHMGEKEDYFSLHAKIISRPSFQPYYTNDTGFMERFHYEAIIESKPEDFSRELRRNL
jgi:galactose-1-phosphate uridylyltransferase